MIRARYLDGPGEDWDDTICFNCGCDLPDEDPDPENTGTSSWWEGFCSEPCRKGEPVTSDEDQLKSLDAYGHLSYVVGYSDEGEDSDRGDWLACFDFKVWLHPSRGVLVAYHAIVNSDSGGFIDTLESDVVEADKAPFTLPGYWADIGMEHGTPWTDQECRDAQAIYGKWYADLRAAIDHHRCLAMGSAPEPGSYGLADDAVEEDWATEGGE